MIYTFFNDYVAQPVINAVTPYIQPMMNFVYNQAVAAFTKGATGVVTTRAARVALDEPAPVAVPVLDRRSLRARAQDGIQNFATGLVSENVTQAGLRAMSNVMPVPAPVLYMAPRATNLTLTRNDDSATAVKNIAFGAMSHGFGTVVQEQVDALLPQAAPYGGYIGYGIASSAARVGLDHVARKIAR